MESAIDGRILSTIGSWARDSLASSRQWLVGTVVVVDAQSIATTAVFRRVTGAWREAVAEVSSLRSSVRSQRVATEALVGVLKSDVVVSFAFAVIHAAFDSHVVGPPMIGGERSVATIVRSASKIVPPSDVRVIRRRRSYSAVDSTVRDWSGVGILYRVATRKSWQKASDLLIDRRRNDTRLTLLVREEFKDVTVLNQTTIVVASVDCFLKSRNVPAIDEVTVEPVASWITLSENEWLFSSIWNMPVKVDSGVDDLKKDRDQVNRVRCRARTVVVGVHRWVGHVGGVVRRVKVNSVPAGREEDLCTNTVWASDVWKLVVVA